MLLMLNVNNALLLHMSSSITTVYLWLIDKTDIFLNFLFVVIVVGNRKFKMVNFGPHILTSIKNPC